MTVRNEELCIRACLDDIIDIFDEVIIIDTGSTDGTSEILRKRYGIAPIRGELSPERCYTLADCRNYGFDRLNTEWIMCLDADERVERRQLIAFKKMAPPQALSGFFCRWNLEEGDAIAEDYKLSLFAKGVQKRGLVHDNVQADLRLKGLVADWYEHLSIRHIPDQSRKKTKQKYYKNRLHKAVKIDPHWHRYHWFLGYCYFRERHLDDAASWLGTCFESRSRFFPVECLNSAMVGAEIHARNEQIGALDRIVDGALEFYERVADDFEVRVNTRIGPWFKNARLNVDSRELEQIVAYRFGH